MNDFHLIIFYQIISISDCLCKLIRLYRMLTKINQSYFDHSHQLHALFQSLQAKHFKFLVNFRAKCSIFWRFIQSSCNNYQITEKINKPRLLVVLIKKKSQLKFASQCYKDQLFKLCSL